MSGKILRRCDLCGRFHAAYLVPDPKFGQLHLCYTCWKGRHGSPPSPAPERGAEQTGEEEEAEDTAVAPDEECEE